MNNTVTTSKEDKGRGATKIDSILSLCTNTTKDNIQLIFKNKQMHLNTWKKQPTSSYVSILEI